MSSKIDSNTAYFKSDKQWRAYIWDPKNPADKAPCTVSIKNGEPVELECWKDLEIFDHFSRSLNFHEPLGCLHGELEDGKPFSVFKIRLENWRSGSGIPSIGLLAQVILRGVSVLSDEGIIEALYLRQQYLDEWINKSPIFVKPSKENWREVQANILIPEEITLFESETLKIYIGHQFSYPMQKVSRMRLYPVPKVAVIFSNPIGVSEALLYREAVKSLLKRLIGVECGVIETAVKTGEYEIQEVYVFENRTTWSYPNFSHRQVFVDLDTMLPFSQEIFSKWLNIYEENREAVREYFRIASSRTLVNQREVFLNAVHGIEMFYKIFNLKPKNNRVIQSNIKKKGDLWKKIETFLELIGEISSDIVPNAELFIKKVVDTRNHFSHYNLNSRKDDPYIIPTNLLGVFSKRLELINTFFLLIQLGIPLRVLLDRFKKHIDYFILKDECRLIE